MKKRNLAFKYTKDGQPALKMVSKKSFMDDLSDFEDGAKVWVTVENYVRKRSLSQNNLFHWYIDLIAKETGNDFDHVKEFMCTRFIAMRPLRDLRGEEVVDEETGEIIMYRPGTSKLEADEFGSLIDNTYQYSLQELNYILPLPEDLTNYHL